MTYPEVGGWERIMWGGRERLLLSHVSVRSNMSITSLHKLCAQVFNALACILSCPGKAARPPALDTFIKTGITDDERTTISTALPSPQPRRGSAGHAIRDPVQIESYQIEARSRCRGKSGQGAAVPDE